MGWGQGWSGWGLWIGRRGLEVGVGIVVGVDDIVTQDRPMIDQMVDLWWIWVGLSILGRFVDFWVYF